MLSKKKLILKKKAKKTKTKSKKKKTSKHLDPVMLKINIHSSNSDDGGRSTKKKRRSKKKGKRHMPRRSMDDSDLNLFAKALRKNNIEVDDFFDDLSDFQSNDGTENAYTPNIQIPKFTTQSNSVTYEMQALPSRNRYSNPTNDSPRSVNTYQSVPRRRRASDNIAMQVYSSTGKLKSRYNRNLDSPTNSLKVDESFHTLHGFHSKSAAEFNIVQDLSIEYQETIKILQKKFTCKVNELSLLKQKHEKMLYENKSKIEMNERLIVEISALKMKQIHLSNDWQLKEMQMQSKLNLSERQISAIQQTWKLKFQSFEATTNDRLMQLKLCRVNSGQSSHGNNSPRNRRNSSAFEVTKMNQKMIQNQRMAQQKYNVMMADLDGKQAIIDRLKLANESLKMQLKLQNQQTERVLKTKDVKRRSYSKRSQYILQQIDNNSNNSSGSNSCCSNGRSHSFTLVTDTDIHETLMDNNNTGGQKRRKEKRQKRNDESVYHDVNDDITDDNNEEDVDIMPGGSRKEGSYI